MFQSGSQVSKDIVVNSIATKSTETIPIADPSTLTPLAGGLTYDPVTGALYYGNGTAWVEVEQGTVTSITQGTGITCTPNPIVDTGIVTLSNTAVAPGTYGDAANVSQVTIDQQGRITNAVDVPIPPLPDTPVTPGTYGDATNVSQVTVDQQGRITNAVDVPIPPLPDTAVTPGTYGDATNVSQITVDQQGRITNAVDVPIPSPVSTGSGQAYLAAPAQAIPDVTPTVVLFDASEYPVLAAQPRFTYAAGVFTCTEAGLYLVNACCIWESFLGVLQLALRKNASDNILTNLTDSTVAANKSQEIVGAVSFGIGDTATVIATRSGAGGISILPGYIPGVDSRGTQIVFVKL
jgi:hypothetical protein